LQAKSVIVDEDMGTALEEMNVERIDAVKSLIRSGLELGSKLKKTLKFCLVYILV
jgi:hypothetical protein